MTFSSKFFLPFVFLVIFLGNYTGAELSCDVYVSPSGTNNPATNGTLGDPYRTITYALDETTAGVICILAGDYPESINITRSVSLVGLPSIPGNVSTNPTIKSISRLIGSNETMSTLTVQSINTVTTGSESIVYGDWESISFDDSGTDLSLVLKGTLKRFSMSRQPSYSRIIRLNLLNPALPTTDSIIEFDSVRALDLSITAMNFQEIKLTSTHTSKMHINATEAPFTHFRPLVTILNCLNNRAHIYAHKLHAEANVFKELTSVQALPSADQKKDGNAVFERFELVNNTMQVGFSVPAGIINDTTTMDVRYNVFGIGSIEVAYHYTPFAGRRNFYGTPMGPSSCVNPNGNGSRIMTGVDFSEFCLNEACTQFSDFVVPEYFSRYRKCNEDEKIAFPLFGLSQFIIIIISGVLWYFNHRIANAYDRRTRAFRIIRIAQIVLSLGVGTLWWAGTKFENACSTIECPEHPHLRSLILVAVVLAVHIIALMATFSSYRKSLVFSVSAISISIMSASFDIFVHLVHVNEDTGPPVVVYYFVIAAIPPLIYQVFISWYSWKLGIGRKLADLEREMEETELLIGSEDTLKSNNILKKKARRLVFGFIPLLVFSLGGAVLSIWIIGRGHHKNIAFAPVAATFYFGASVILCIIAIVALLRRFYDSLIYWIALGVSVASFLLGCASTAFLASAVADSSGKEQHWSEKVTIIIALVNVVVVVYHLMMAVLMFRMRIQVDALLPELLDTGIDRAFDELYDGAISD